ncbi:AP-1 complex subunit sigma-1A [Sceloporus undulatus]|uniref:AP-1 complex subunit sigma-1A n=1 Tax=Sceloporus undulatus TaxID=8520 RepID=UPI001C4BE13D|nr:AP-1 complex subunit sigma-1A [Sceloporus undulatus]
MRGCGRRGPAGREALGSSSEEEEGAAVAMMRFMLLFSRQGKLRLQKWYLATSDRDKKKMVRELMQVVLARKPKMCSFLEWRDLKVVYKRYASLYFCCAIEGQDNELITLELIHRYVELLDKYFGSVSGQRPWGGGYCWPKGGRGVGWWGVALTCCPLPIGLCVLGARQEAGGDWGLRVEGPGTPLHTNHRKKWASSQDWTAVHLHHRLRETALVEGCRVAPWERAEGRGRGPAALLLPMVKEKHPRSQGPRLTRDDQLGPKDFKKYRVIAKQ